MFEELYKEHFKRIYNYIYFRVGNHVDAEDLTADVFVRAYEYLDSYNSEKGVMSAWLGGIARNVVSTYFRKNAERPQIIELSEFLCAKTDIEEEFQNKETLDFLMVQMKCLPKRQQELLAMKYFLGLNNREIAKIMDMSESLVGVTIFRSLSKLRKKIFEEV